ncbi:hypothetical protein [Arthrobacter rhombi]|uniref:hypothetical protein n=1 Tax=Arthrobacter rhombi TaxID=71253 RepID=UPI003FD5CCAE
MTNNDLTRRNAKKGHIGSLSPGHSHEETIIETTGNKCPKCPTGTFTDWLQRQKYRHDPIGELARDFIQAAQDGTHADHYERPDELRQILHQLTTYQPVIDALDRAETEWTTTPQKGTK